MTRQQKTTWKRHPETQEAQEKTCEPYVHFSDRKKTLFPHETETQTKKEMANGDEHDASSAAEKGEPILEEHTISKTSNSNNSNRARTHGTFI